MASLDFLSTVRNSGVAKAWRMSGRWLRHWLPTGLYTRSLLIIILPMILLQIEGGKPSIKGAYTADIQYPAP